MKKIFHLSTCSTCKKILDSIDKSDFELQDIKEKNISPAELDFVAERMGGYEAIFSKRAMKFRSMGLHEMNLSESDYRNYMLNEYTFLKRPFVVDGDEVYIGNAKKTIEKLIEKFG